MTNDSTHCTNTDGSQSQAIDSEKGAIQSSSAHQFSARQFRDAMGQFATGVIVISTQVQGQPHAMTANAFMSVSLEPPLIVVSVAQTARMHQKIIQAGRFGVSVLELDQLAISNHFAGKPKDGISPTFDLLEGQSVIGGSVLQIVADLQEHHTCGDHTLFIGHVKALRRPGRELAPLLYHRGRYAEIAKDTSIASEQGLW